MRAEQSRCREREVCVRALGEQDLGSHSRGSPSDSQKLGLGAFFEGKKVAKGVCNVAKLVTLCISISPTTG